MDKCNEPKIRHIKSKDLPLWREDTLPESATLLMLVTEQDRNCGQYLPFAYQLPTSFLTPGNSTSNNVTSLNGNGANIVIPDHQVRAGYVFNNSPNDIRLADKDDGTKPMFLIVARNKENSDLYDIVTDGVYKFNTNHEYVVGYTYYLGVLGQPTTENTGTPLFDVLDKNKIRVHLG